MTESAKTVWITGASSGIGAALVKAYGRLGWRVAATARREDMLISLQDSPGDIQAFACDVTDRRAMQACFSKIVETFGCVDLAIANAGIYLPTRLPDFDAELFDRSFEVNVTGTVNLLVPVIPHMRENGQGHIAIVSSVAGYSGLPTSAAYGATKAALTNMGESLALDLKRSCIDVSVIAPGFVDTPATAPNKFKMPFLMDVDAAAQRIVKGLSRKKAHIAFPRRFTFWLRLMTFLPRGAYLKLLGR
ncbi:MAG: SDR family NAD(P)-dependent oxidoreductase [Parvibaculales bacterium]